MRRHNRVDCAIRRSRGNSRATHGSKKTTLKRLHIRRVDSDHVRNAPRQKVTEESEARSQHRVLFELPSDRRSWLQDRKRCRGKYMAEPRLDRGIQRLIDIM